MTEKDSSEIVIPVIEEVIHEGDQTVVRRHDVEIESVPPEEESDDDREEAGSRLRDGGF